MNPKLAKVGHIAKSILFTLFIHGGLILVLLAGLWWPFKNQVVSFKPVNSIQAEAISINEIEAITKQTLEKEKAKQAAEKRRKTEEKAKQVAEEKRKAKEKAKQIAEKKRKAKEKAKQAAEEKRKAKEKAKQAAEEKRKAKEKAKQAAEEKRLAEEALQRQIEEEQQTLDAAMDAFHRASARIRAAIEEEWIRPASSRSGLKVTIRVKLSSLGDVLSTDVVKSSGDTFFDRSAELAVMKASPLPFPMNPKYYQHLKEVDLVFNPDNFH